MRNSRLWAVAVGAVTLSMAGVANAQAPVPERVNFNARLTDSSGVPVSGSHQVQLALFDAVTAGTSAWTETTTPTFSATGTVSIEMGATTPLTANIFDGTKLYLQITVDGTPLTPRVGVVSVPYAIRAGAAATASRLGSLQETDVQRRVAGSCALGQAIRTIAADGTVTCASIPDAGSLSSSGGFPFVASYDFEEGSGTTSSDGSGGGHTLTLSASGAAWTTAGHTGRALSFDGASGSATAPSAPAFDLGPAASMEAWVFVPAIVAGTMTIVARGTAFRLALVNMRVQASFETITGPAPALVGAGIVQANTWVHVAASYDGLMIRTFVNGRLTSETPYPNGQLMPSSSVLTLGAAGSADYFGGKIDEVRIAPMALRSTDRRGNLLCGLTAPTTGNQGGWVAARTACEAACGTTTAHLCDASEIARSWQYGAALPAGGAWVGSINAVATVTGGTGGGVTGESTFFKNYRGCCNWDTGQFAITAVTLRTPVASTYLSNCNGWTGGGGYGQTASVTDFSLAACGASLPAACCD